MSVPQPLPQVNHHRQSYGWEISRSTDIPLVQHYNREPTGVDRNPTGQSLPKRDPPLDAGTPTEVVVLWFSCRGGSSSPCGHPDSLARGFPELPKPARVAAPHFELFCHSKVAAK